MLRRAELFFTRIDAGDTLAALPSNADGIVAGHPFCLTRVGARSPWELIPLLRRAREKGLRAALQTFVYQPPAVIAETRALVGALEREELVDGVIVSDPGLLHALRGSALEKTWSRWGWPREYPWMEVPFSGTLLEALGEMGADSFEATVETCRWLAEHAETPGQPFHLVLERRSPVSFHRFCYHERLTGTLCRGEPLCGREALFLEDRDFPGGVRLQVDGFTLVEDELPDAPPAEEPAFVTRIVVPLEERALLAEAQREGSA